MQEIKLGNLLDATAKGQVGLQSARQRWSQQMMANQAQQWGIGGLYGSGKITTGGVVPVHSFVILYCSECKHIRPRKNWDTFWGLWRRQALKFAKCGMGLEITDIVDKDWAYIQPLPPKPKTYRSCYSRRSLALCPDFSPATPEAETKLTLVKLGEKP